MVTVTTKQHIIEDNNYSNCCGYSSLEGDYSNGIGGVEISDKKTPTGGGAISDIKTPTGGGAKEEPKMMGIELREFVAVSPKSTKKDKLKTKDSAMSNTTKILIGLGIALVLGTTIYFIAKK
jgi:hypothetical protein